MIIELTGIRLNNVDIDKCKVSPIWLNTDQMVDAEWIDHESGMYMRIQTVEGYFNIIATAQEWKNIVSQMNRGFQG